ncbi:MAG: ArnT family glycosyltransferase [Pirellulales bacterium]
MCAAVVGYTGIVWAARGELGMVWDEPPGIERQAAVRRWLGDALGTGQQRGRAFSAEGLREGWPFCRAAPNEHPPVSAIVSLLTRQTTGWLVGPLRAHRLATVVMFGLAAGVLFRFVRCRWGSIAAGAALGALVFNPRVFAHGQLATTDAIAGAFAFLAAVAMLRSVETGRKPWLFGVLAGLAVMSKLAGALVLPAMLLWTAVWRPRGAGRVWAWSLPVIPVVMILVHPGWWRNPAAGVGEWVRAVAHYEQKVPVYYLGRVYDSRTAHLPWHNPWVLTGTAIPPGLLALAALGAVALPWSTVSAPGGGARGGVDGSKSVASASQGTTFDAQRSTLNAQPLPDHAVAGWALVSFLLPLVLRMFPFMPGHDGLRQMLPAFFFLPVLAAFGVVCVGRATGGAVRFVTSARFVSSAKGNHRVSHSATGAGARWAAWAALIAAVVCIGPAAWATLRFHPYELAYYNALVGGPAGAKRAGLETTYYWDAVSDEVIASINANLPRGSKLLIFPPPDVRTFDWLQRWGTLRGDLQVWNLDPPHFNERIGWMLDDEACYLVFLMRQGLYMPRAVGQTDLFARLAEAPAAFELVPQAVGVRLVAIFDRQTFRAVLRRAEPERETSAKRRHS